MTVEILVKANYAKFGGEKVEAQELEVGTIATFPASYEADIVKAKLAKFVSEVIFEQDLADERTIVEQVDEQIKKGKKGRGVKTEVSLSDPDALNKMRS